MPFNRSLAKLPFNLGHGWVNVITSWFKWQKGVKKVFSMNFITHFSSVTIVQLIIHSLQGFNLTVECLRDTLSKWLHSGPELCGEAAKTASTLRCTKVRKFVFYLACLYTACLFYPNMKWSGILKEAYLSVLLLVSRCYDNLCCFIGFQSGLVYILLGPYFDMMSLYFQISALQLASNMYHDHLTHWVLMFDVCISKLDCHNVLFQILVMACSMLSIM